MVIFPSPQSPVNAGCQTGKPCLEVLAPTRSSKHRGYSWVPAAPGCPCSGTLVLDTDRRRERYDVTEFPVAPGYGSGRGFQLRKPDGEVYHVFLADDRRMSTCDCAGFTYEATRKADRRHGTRTDSLSCKHLDCLASVVQNGWLPDPRCNAATYPAGEDIPL